MASKRKSTVPCMIPSKSKHVREEIILGSLPELLPTIPEDSILSIYGEECGRFSHGEMQRGGAYSCSACRFESRDLNYFLDHMHNCHLDFRAQPTFYCLDCGVSVVRFEALALHNAKAHPKIMEGLVTASLTVNKRDGVTTADQSLFTVDGGEDYRESSAISLTKTPIAKMMKAKGEHKKIVVSHTVEVRKIDTGKDVDASMLTNVPELQNGALSVSAAPAMPRTTVHTHVMTTVSDQVFHQHTPSLYSPSSCNSNKDLPKVMIPLSSIPTYDAAMDTSSFLKTSFGKFPYPTKAELCYLTVVSEFPEEQIKLWFTAQRLKQGISWSPEEIDEARRKMFNTVFQGGAPQKQSAAAAAAAAAAAQQQQHANHIVSHHTISAQLGSKGPNFQMAKLPFGGAKTRPIGVLTTQANMSTNPHVTRVSYSTPIVPPPKFPPIYRTTQVLSKNAPPSVETNKSNGLDMAANSGYGSSTSSSRSSSSSSSSSSSLSSSISSSISSSYMSSSNGGDAVTRKTVHSSNNDEHCVADTNGKANVKSNSLPADSTESHVIICTNHSPQEPAHATQHHDKHAHNYAHKAGVSDSNSTSIITHNSSSSSILDQDYPVKGMSILKQLINEDEDRAAPEVKGQDPIKINFKRLKMSEAENASELLHHEHKKSDVAELSAPQTPFSPPWGNKTPQQLHVLRQVFSSVRWPSSQQYEDLSVQTGLPKPEVVRWFSDSRYSHKNGQLKWLETYQRLPTEAEDTRGHGDAGAEPHKEPHAAKKEGDAGLKAEEQVSVWQDSYSPLLSLMGSAASREQGPARESAQREVLQVPWSETADHHQQPEDAQSIIEQQADANQARDRLRMELLEV